jgi:hypothetical protein
LEKKLTLKERNLLEAAAYFIMMSAAEIADDVVDDVERGEFGNFSLKQSNSDNWLVNQIYSALLQAHIQKDEAKFTSYIKDIYSYSPNEFFQIVSLAVDKVAEPDTALGFKRSLRDSARVMMLAADGIVDDAEQMYLEFLEDIFGLERSEADESGS